MFDFQKRKIKTWVSDAKGVAWQHMQYEPYGGGWVDERSGEARSTGFSSRYRFTGKERDAESGLDYFGARYYWSDGALWLSVDPLADKYPFLSPYVYGACNPVVLVDVDGREVYVIGTNANRYVRKFNTRHLKVRVDENGKLYYVGQAKSQKEKMIAQAIDDERIRIHLIIGNEKNIPDWLKKLVNLPLDKEVVPTMGGAFLGNLLDKENGLVNCYQYIYPKDLPSGKRFYQHELIEAYIGGQMALERSESIKPASLDHTTYEEAHRKANEFSKAEVEVIVPDKTPSIYENELLKQLNEYDRKQRNSNKTGINKWE